RKDDIGMQIDKFLGQNGQLSSSLRSVTPFDEKIFALDILHLPKLFAKAIELGDMPLVRGQHADAAHPLALLRPSRVRPCGCCATNERDELASLHPRNHSMTSSARAIRSLFRPHCHRGSDCGCKCLNRPTVLALRNDSEAIRLRVLPGRAKALRIKFPRTTVLVAGFCERLTGHLAVRRKRHSE